jgi:hypothetical protein
MSERSIYLRDQADKCRQQADTLSDAQTREELRKLAAVYVARAAVIENKEQTGSEQSASGVLASRGGGRPHDGGRVGTMRTS